MSKLSNSQKKTAYKLYKQGYKQKKIAELLDVSQATISQVCKEMDLKEQAK